MASVHPIIVEGPDGGGKTRLAKQLAELYALEYRRPPDEVLSSTDGPLSGALVEWWDQQLALPTENLVGGVYDRCTYISDPIYQQAQAGRSLLIPSEQFAYGIMRLWVIEPILIFCLPDFTTQLHNVHASGRDRLAGVDDSDLEKISNQYWAYFAMWANSLFENTLVWDYETPGAWNHLLTRLAGLGCEEEK